MQGGHQSGSSPASLMSGPRSVRVAFAVVAAFAVIALAARSALACQIPVFRYALERWPVDDYELVLLHSGTLSEDVETLARRLDEAASGPLNLKVRRVDITQPLPEGIPSTVTQIRDLPALGLRYPDHARIDASAWSGALLPATVGALLDSPARREIARRILDGHAVVWALLECSDGEKNRRARAALDESLAALGREIKLPSREVLEGDSEWRSGFPITLKIEFSVVPITAGDRSEDVFRSTLLGLEPDLREVGDEPIAIPVYGRARALHALVGAGIHGDTIVEAVRTLTGPCACTLKRDNPGTDLLFAVEWPPEPPIGPPRPLAELPGPVAAGSAPPMSRASDSAAPAAPGETAPRSFSTLWLLLGGGALVIALASLRRRHGRGG